MQTKPVARIDELVQAQKRSLVATTPTSSAISELATRVDSLEETLRELTLEVETLAGRAPPFLDPQYARRFRPNV